MKEKYQARAYCLSKLCRRKVIIGDAVQCGSRISGICPWCGNKVSTLRIKECSDPKPYTKKVKTRAMIKKSAKRAEEKRRRDDWV